MTDRPPCYESTEALAEDVLETPLEMLAESLVASPETRKVLLPDDPQTRADTLWLRVVELMMRLRPGLYLLAIALCLSGLIKPPVALALGMAMALTLDNPWRKTGHRTAMWLLQICVVLLGFTMNLQAVLVAGLHGAVFAAISIGVTLLAGRWLGRKLGIDSQTSLLISTGTAICGGSAIAAVGSVIDAGESSMTLAMGTVFLLNAVALYLFPILGHALNLSQVQFGVWAGIAIHDISSVVAAASSYGPTALTTATAVKLSRALWIVPLSFAVAWLADRKDRRRVVENPGLEDAQRAKPRKKHIPWFIGVFLLACIVRSFVPGMDYLSGGISRVGDIGLTVTLFLIGTGLSRKTLASVGIRPMVQGVLLWILIGGGALVVVKTGLF